MTREYIVGGYIRDRFLGEHSKDKDYVVTGATPQDMIERGYKQVGADFPVFLDNMGNEWSLARRERKSGKGYLGFDVDFDPSVTIEEDLYRRDLTINAIAVEVFNDMKTRIVEFIDPYGGQEDIDNKILRHVSESFEEDPVRVLRLARFRARFGPEWSVAPETKDLVYSMAKKGVLDELDADRVWKEMSRALMEDHPRLFFDTLLECDALHVLFSTIYKLKTSLESRKWHPEGDAYEHTMLVLTQSALNNSPLVDRYCALVHDLGKTLTPRERMPKHYGHDVNGVKVVRDFSNQYRVPSKIRDTAMKVTRYHMAGHKLEEMNAKTFVKMFDELRIVQSDMIERMMAIFKHDTRGRLGSENDDVDHLNVFRVYARAYMEVKFADVFPDGETNPNKISQEMFKEKVKSVARVKSG